MLLLKERRKIVEEYEIIIIYRRFSSEAEWDLCPKKKRTVNIRGCWSESSRLRSLRYSYLTTAPTLATRIVNWIREPALFEGTERATVVHCILSDTSVGSSSSVSDSFFSRFAIRHRLRLIVSWLFIVTSQLARIVRAWLSSDASLLASLSFVFSYFFSRLACLWHQRVFAYQGYRFPSERADASLRSKLPRGRGPQRQ